MAMIPNWPRPLDCMSNINISWTCFTLRYKANIDTSPLLCSYVHSHLLYQYPNYALSECLELATFSLEYPPTLSRAWFTNAYIPNRNIETGMYFCLVYSQYHSSSTFCIIQMQGRRFWCLPVIGAVFEGGMGLVRWYVIWIWMGWLPSNVQSQNPIQIGGVDSIHVSSIQYCMDTFHLRLGRSARAPARSQRASSRYAELEVGWSDCSTQACICVLFNFVCFAS